MHHLPAHNSWRYVFLVGVVPAVMVVLAGRKLREPRWLELKQLGQLSHGGLFDSYAKLLRSTRWRRILIIGSLIASTGVVGLWAIGEYAVDLQRSVFKTFYEQNPGHGDVTQRVNEAVNHAYLLQMAGAAAGMWLFTRIATAMGKALCLSPGIYRADCNLSGVLETEFPH